MIYAAESRVLAIVEVMVHITLANLPSDFIMVEINVSKDMQIKILKPNILDPSWNSNPFSRSTQTIGDDFVHLNKNYLLKAPSTVVEGDFNYLINPRHKNFTKMKISKAENFPFNLKIFKN